MKIDIIDDFVSLQKIKANWDYVYKNDPQAQFFLSWEWLSGWLQKVYEPWLILAAKPNANHPYVAFFPLKLAISQAAGGVFQLKLCMAGNSMADYTGLLSLPEYEERIISSFSDYIRRELCWSSFDLKNVLEADRRISALLDSFTGGDIVVRKIQAKRQSDDIDHHICPFLLLESSWDQYLKNSLSSHSRQKIRRFLRQLDRSDEFHITQVDADNLESHIEILLKFWESRWRERKGKQGSVIANFLRTILRHGFEQKCLYFPVLWKGDRPLGAIANFMDFPQKTMLVYVTGRDINFKNPSPGLILHADATRYAIQHGFERYDFLRGNEGYKYSLGAQECRIQHIEIIRKNYHRQPLDSRVMPLALNLTLQAHRANQFPIAEQGYLQLLAAEPNHPEALYGLGLLKEQQGKYKAAEALWKNLLEIQPDSLRSLFSLGHLYQLQGQLSQAIEAYNQILALRPDVVAAHNNLGYAFQQQGKWEDAIRCYQKALEFNPDCIEAEVNRANALNSQGKLSSERKVHYAALNYDLGCKSKQVGNLQSAIAYYQQAIAMNPDLAQAHHDLELVIQGQRKSANATLDDLKLFQHAIPEPEFETMIQVFPESHFARLKQEGFLFYQTTFWYPLDRDPDNIFEQVVKHLRPLANPDSTVIGVEWWFSVVMTDTTPQWLLPCHFDRNDLAERDINKIRHPDLSSVLFLNAVPYGELVITDQVLKKQGISPAQPKDMRFINPSRNLYAVFPGSLYHGVIGRMWRPAQPPKLRMAMAVNWWTEKPKSTHLHDSRDCMSVFGLSNDYSAVKS